MRCKLLVAMGLVALPGCAYLEEGRPPAEPPPGAEVVGTEVDYSLALRTAALKLTGNLPTLTEISQVMRAEGDGKRVAYEKLLDGYLAHPRFALQQLAFWRNTFKIGGSARLDTAPAFAALLVVSGRPMTELVTAQGATCGVVENGSLKAQHCNNGVEAVGVLTDPGVLAHFYGPMAFRRTRWVQETFLCAKFPVEIGDRSERYPSGIYFSPWEMTSISGKRNNPMALVNFHETDKGELCANCHTTMNHIAPLLATFDEMGTFRAPMAGAYPVRTPVPGSPASRLVDWLPPGEPTAWRYGLKTPDLKSLGAAIAADPGFARCLATRLWNWALSRGDVIIDEARLTPELASELVAELVAGNYDARRLIRRIFLSDAFVRY
ncbi:MAG: DUF1588 domain-containing protein [Myxococcales bacterium]|nr:DUF1588 domain-containing protein [Myxococcota bacterium]MDW8281303.1 DUF1588 domain-containing protein [Myxococcales bacterium]